MVFFRSNGKKRLQWPVFKAGDACLVNTYRPVSLLYALSKGFEIVVHGRPSFYFRQKINHDQHGFFQGRSVETNLCTFFNYSFPVVFDQGQLDTIYFDISKAFGTVNHVPLLSKLQLYGLCPQYLAWFKSHLSLCKNLVQILNIWSHHFTSTSGVPQGSNLGPLPFFSLYKWYCFLCKYAKMLLFADDVKLYSSVGDIGACLLLQQDIDCMSRWCSSNNLFLNPQEMKIIRFLIHNSYKACFYHAWPWRFCW